MKGMNNMMFALIVSNKTNKIMAENIDTGIYVAYYRVSTNKQGISGLGLEAQQKAVQDFCAKGVIVQEFIEVESGKKAKRPELLKALQLCKEKNYTLIIAKLDRLARNVLFTATLMESKVKFKAVDMPEADTFTIHIIAAVAEREALNASVRTKAAIKARIARGEKHGERKTAKKGSLKARQIARMGGKAREYPEPPLTTLELIKMYSSNGFTVRQISEKLSELEISVSKSTVSKWMNKYIKKSKLTA